MPVKKIKVQEGDKEQEVFIAMTDEEARDTSYVDYLVEGQTEKTREQLRKKSEKPSPQASKGEIAEALKEYGEFKKREGRKYF